MLVVAAANVDASCVPFLFLRDKKSTYTHTTHTHSEEREREREKGQQPLSAGAAITFITTWKMERCLCSL